MLFLHVAHYESKPVEIFVNNAVGQIGIMYDGKSIGALSHADTKQIVHYLVNHDRIDLEELAEAKRIRDEGECTCRQIGSNKDVVQVSYCARHFRA